MCIEDMLRFGFDQVDTDRVQADCLYITEMNLWRLLIMYREIGIVIKPLFIYF